MKLRVEGIRCGDCVRTITDAVLDLDVGARINVDAGVHHVGIAGRMSLEQAQQAIEAHGFRVASIVDPTLEDAVWKGARPAVAYF